MDCRFWPLTAWPGPLQKSSGRARFRSTWGATLAVLQRELQHLAAHDVIVEIDVDEADIRLDGWPRAGLADGVDRPSEPSSHERKPS